MVDRVLDDESGIIYVTGRGTWSLEEVDAHFDALREMIAGQRREGKPIRILSDVAGAPRQDEATERHILGQIQRTYLPGDRVAILTGNADDRGHVKRLLGNAEVALFCSRLPAEMWLLLDELDQQRRAS